MHGIAGVASGYAHYEKKARFRGFEDHGALRLKWYDLATGDRAVPEAKHGEARRALTGLAARGDLNAAGELGFSIVHRCGESFYFLLLTVWRGSNEVWEAVYYSDADQPEFAPFSPAYPAIGAFRPTFCVWELAIVGFEARAWAQFLSTRRGPADFERWKEMAYNGVA